MLAGVFVEVTVTPRVEGDGLDKVRAGPFHFIPGTRHQGSQSLFGAGVVPDVQPVLVEGLAEGVDLRSGDLDFGFADLGEIFRADVAGQQSDDDHDDQEFEEGEAGMLGGVAGHLVIEIWMFICW